MIPISPQFVWLADLNPGSQSNLAQVPLNWSLVANAQAWQQMSSTAGSPENRMSYSLDESMTWWQTWHSWNQWSRRWECVIWRFVLLNRSLFIAWGSVSFSPLQIITRMLYLQLQLGGSFRLIMTYLLSSHFQFLTWHWTGRRPVLPSSKLAVTVTLKMV